MTTPHHAADDGSLARSTGGAAARGALLIALAVIIGLVLLAFALDDEGTDVSVGDDTSSEQPSDGDDGTGADNGDSGDSGDGTATASSTTTTPPTTITQAPAGDPRDPAEVNVLVANGTGAKGLASRVSDKLKARGYIAEASNAPSTANSVIFYRDGFADDARAVAEIVGTTPDVIQPAPDAIAVSQVAIEDGRLEAANVVVIVGADGKIPDG